MKRETAPKPRKQTFALEPDPAVKEVCLAGEFSEWKPVAMKKRLGKYQTSLELVAGDYQYKFVVDGVWCADPACAESVPDGFGGCNSVLRVG